MQLCSDAGPLHRRVRLHCVLLIVAIVNQRAVGPTHAHRSARQGVASLSADAAPAVPVVDPEDDAWSEEVIEATL